MAACGLLLAATPFAVAGSDGPGDSAPRADAAATGDPIREGRRNPSRGAATRETQVIANNATYGTRQSNLSSNGGGAIYGCRSGPGGTPQNNRPCVRANNLRDGLAFEFNTNQGTVGGVISRGNLGGVHMDSVPFVTNMGGMVENLNAHRVGGLTAEQIAAVGAMSPGPPAGPAGGDLDGTYPNPAVADNVVDSTKLAIPVVRIGAQGQVDDGTSGQLVGECQSGERMLSGGGRWTGDPAGTILEASFPITNTSWAVTAFNDSGDPQNLQVWVLCLPTL